MKIAVTYDNGEVFQHFGRCEQFKYYTVEYGKIVREEVISNNGIGHGALAGILRDNGATVLICGGIGGGAQVALAEAGVKVLGGVCGSADEAVKAYLSGNLAFDENVHCDHHDHEHGEHGHDCGSHGCGGHKCH